MLIIGDFGLNTKQQRTQMALWSIWASPMLMSNDLRNISSDSVSILQNKDVIAGKSSLCNSFTSPVSQDALGIQGTCVKCSVSQQVWSRQLSPDSSSGASTVAVALFNPGILPAKLTFNFEDVGLGTTVQVHCDVRYY